MQSALTFQRASSFELAPAKVNLTLEIKGKRQDGYHELESLVLFADFGDRLRYRPGGSFSLEIGGPFAAALGAGDNLIKRAAQAYASAQGGEANGAFDLEKNLPVAAGLGGGSADAAAALRLLRRRHGAPADLAALLPAARSVGADVPCCLYSRAALMTGIGERLHLLQPVPPIPALLVNPMRPLPTGEVFRELAAAPLAETPTPVNAPALASLSDVLAYASARRNDLEPPARRLLPVIDEVLAALAAAPGVLLRRLSGSGPTCFALFAEMAEAEAAAATIAREQPGWWVQPVHLS
jgi:4-diphosphocytidyl-2-C-methyl-D-erythritol kinase